LTPETYVDRYVAGEGRGNSMGRTLALKLRPSLLVGRGRQPPRPRLMLRLRPRPTWSLWLHP
jgi:hypothetical protein